MFAESIDGYNYDVATSTESTMDLTHNPNDDLNKFFSRPIKIGSFTWSTSLVFFQSFNPWTLFFTNPRVANRIANYNLLKCKLKIKVVINGNPFFYGRALVDYNPLNSEDDFIKNRQLIAADLTAASQRPHFFLDPCLSQGGEMTLPFIFPFNALNVPDSEWTNMGQLTIREFQPLRHANGSIEPVNVSVLCWAEEVQLSVLTSSEAAGLLPQSGDEYGTDIISKPATAIAKAAGKLAVFPTIAPYMRATQIVASGAASVAAAFGYSRPNSMECAIPVRPTSVGNMASGNLQDTSVKLALDAKNEVTIDPRVVGLTGIDEMSIVTIAKHPSYVTQFNWSRIAITETLLWTSYVTPIQFGFVTQPPSIDEYHFTPSAHIALPFKYWRGSMKFRFQVVCSSFHRGRLRIVYDPQLQVSNEYNTNYSTIIDIADEKDFEICIGWGVTKPYLEVYGGDRINFLPYQLVPLETVRNTTTNGMISVYVMNELTTPNTTISNDASVNVFTAMCDDFEVAVPTSRMIENFSYLRPPINVVAEAQSGELGDVSIGEKTSAPSIPIMESSLALMGGPELAGANELANICFGESIVSIRTLLKRYCYHSLLSDSSLLSNVRVLRFYENDFPYYRGFTAVAQSKHRALIAATSYNYNFSRQTLLNYFTPAYVGWRGSIRQKYVNTSLMNANGRMPMCMPMSVTRNNGLFPILSYSHSGTASSPPLDNFGAARFGVVSSVSTINGTDIVMVNNNGVLEVELPYYRNRRFAYARVSNRHASVNVDDNSHIISVVSVSDILPLNLNHLERYVAAGDDFQLYFFIGVPIMYFHGTPPSDLF
uniref:Uncharacterized protein n=1 Tax=Fish-associated picorna-like virus 2 TaxID=3003958 RepID=A0A9E9FYJ1_9VIRU|nr:MAG: hypothetical protein [Fish-associated picorna-like virus 2]